MLVNLILQTHSKYVILIDFPLQQWLRERSVILLYSTCLVYEAVSVCLSTAYQVYTVRIQTHCGDIRAVSVGHWVICGHYGGKG